MVPIMLKRFLEPAALMVLLVVIGLRPLVGESYHTSGPGMTHALGNMQDPWAWATLLMDALVLLIAAGVTLHRVIAPARVYRRGGIEWGAAVMAVAALVSCVWAGEKRPAINASIDLVAAIAMSLALLQLLDRRWKIRLTLCVVVASAATNAAECANQRFVSFEETEQAYRENREQLWGRQGVPLDSPQVRLFEQRMRSREASGYFAHSNIAGGYLLLGGFVVAGFVLAGLRREDGHRRSASAAVGVFLAACLFGAILLTRSKGAMVAGVTGFLLLGARMFWAPWFARNRRKVFIGGWTLVIVIVTGAVAFGIVRGGLPGASLDFRWNYWTASAAMFDDYWPTGVGAENFGDHYLQYKSIDSPEEVKTPHNFLVQFATEYGVVGLLGVLLMLVGGAYRITEPSPRLSHASPDRADASKSPTVVVIWAAALAVAILGARVFLLPSSNPYFIVWVTGVALLPWVAAFVRSEEHTSELQSH